MQLLRFIYLLVSLLYIYAGIKVLVIDRRNIINRAFLLLTACLGVWAVAMLLLTLTMDYNSIILMKALARFAKFSFYAAVLYFAMLVCGWVNDSNRLIVLPFISIPVWMNLYLNVFKVREFAEVYPMAFQNPVLKWLEVAIHPNYLLLFTILLTFFVATFVYIRHNIRHRFTTNIKTVIVLSAVFMVFMLAGAILGILENRLSFINPDELSLILFAVPICIIYYLIVKGEYFVEKEMAFTVLQTLESTQEAFLITSEDYIINRVNDEVERISGYYVHQLYGMNAKNIFADLDAEETTLLCADQSRRSITLSHTLINDANTGLSFRVISFRDIEDIKKIEQQLLSMNTLLEERVERRRVVLYTIQKQMEKEIEEKKKLEDELSRLVYYDMLTELFNRVMFHEKLQKRIRYERRDMAVLSIDIDNFKRINDTFGHNEGDRILIQLAELIRARLRAGEIAARIEGDEFLILLNKIYGEEDIKARVDEIQEAVKHAFFVKDLNIFLTISVGAAYYTDGLSANDLIYNASVALYGAKIKGVGGFEIYSKEGRNYLKEKIKVRQEIERAIRENEFELYYQPQILIGKEKVNGTEALVRWNHPEKGLISPGEFIPQIENENLIIKLGEWVIENACKQIKEWEETYRYEFLPVSINLSMRHFETEDILVYLRKMIQTYEIHPAHLKLEITESFRSEELYSLHSILAKIQEENISLSVDDFGTGYSSFHYLKNIKADVLKIPREYIIDIGQNKKSEYIVKSMIDLAHDLNMLVVAEGVESEEEKEFLEQQLCDFIQGYYYFKPMKKAMLERIS
ncbi:MAG: bifunctional diguanylate cyclase/phosphodiesterase [Eubacteriales bacterium]|nr:bifunctional diguanylate cyclase/phosphodiesterase [Eubacteriales bacterium]